MPTNGRSPGGYLMYDYTCSADGYDEYIRGGGEPPETPTWLFVVVLYAFFGTWLFIVHQISLGAIYYISNLFD
jgi:hypothetical protein